ncbi:hypothetical protein [Streptomyces rishiriensis]|uniref:Uncharacterized protein n=1 Tax=Streptomyces rishiriensis TaxID=68264 RepID=A0ABU0NZ90_STRRH|nr:hypothetical protein [Streptomyces rishiriensis]MDQ0583750.1 hypothetical protein [Streptomyces rishiriensis]
MDAGVAALLGAVAGALGAMGAGWISAWGTREQAKTQARADITRWHLQERQRVYTDFMRAAVTTGAALSGLTAVFRERDAGAAERRLQTCRGLISELTSTCALAILHGPQDVTALAINFCNAIDELLGLAEQWKNAIIADDQEKIDELSTEYDEMRDEINSCANEFAEAANAVLVKEEAAIEAL